jgi:hypothetical protein
MMRSGAVKGRCKALVRCRTAAHHAWWQNPRHTQHDEDFPMTSRFHIPAALQRLAIFIMAGGILILAPVLFAA